MSRGERERGHQGQAGLWRWVTQPAHRPPARCPPGPAGGPGPGSESRAPRFQHLGQRPASLLPSVIHSFVRSVDRPSPPWLPLLSPPRFLPQDPLPLGVCPQSDLRSACAAQAPRRPPTSFLRSPARGSAATAASWRPAPHYSQGSIEGGSVLCPQPARQGAPGHLQLSGPVAPTPAMPDPQVLTDRLGFSLTAGHLQPQVKAGATSSSKAPAPDTRPPVLGLLLDASPGAQAPGSQ